MKLVKSANGEKGKLVGQLLVNFGQFAGYSTAFQLAAAPTQTMRWSVVLLQCLSLLARPLYTISTKHLTGVCEIVCGAHRFVAPCFLLPREGCLGQRAEALFAMAIKLPGQK